MSFNGDTKGIWLDRTKIIEQVRDIDINHTKRKFTEIKSTLIIPKVMFETDYTDSEEATRRMLNNEDIDDFGSDDFDEDEEEK